MTRRPDDIEIHRAANQLIKWKGRDASFGAAARADAMLDKGDVDGQRVWMRILKAIEELQRQQRSDGELVH